VDASGCWSFHKRRLAPALLLGDPCPLAALPNGAEDRAHEAALKMAMRSRGKMTAMEATAWATPVGAKYVYLV
jgi:hypothetical protein